MLRYQNLSRRHVSHGTSCSRRKLCIKAMRILMIYENFDDKIKKVND